MSAENQFQNSVEGGVGQKMENLWTLFMDNTFRHRKNLLHRSHPPGTLLDQFLHLIPAEKNIIRLFKSKCHPKVIQKSS